MTWKRTKIRRLHPKRWYEESLDLRKIYETLEDRDAEKDGLIRLIDEDEDYLYPRTRFLPIELPTEIEAALVDIANA